MEQYVEYLAPSPSPLPPMGGEDKGEGGIGSKITKNFGKCLIKRE